MRKKTSVKLNPIDIASLEKYGGEKAIPEDNNTISTASPAREMLADSTEDVIEPLNNTVSETVAITPKKELFILTKSLPKEVISTATSLLVKAGIVQQTPQAEAPQAEAPDQGKNAQEAQPEPEVTPGGIFENYLNILRMLRVVVQDLQEALQKVRDGKMDLQFYSSFINSTRDDINALINDLKVLIANKSVDTQHSDTLRRLLNKWQQMQINPVLMKPEDKLEAQQQANYLDEFKQHARDIVVLVGILTIPDRVNKWLKEQEPGYHLPFHLIFSDELPDEADRLQVLKHLVYAPKMTKGGIVDFTSGVIFRYESNPSKRTRIWLWLLLMFVVPIVILMLLALPIPTLGSIIPQGTFPVMLIGWFSILAGIAVHWGVSITKTSQRQGGLPPILSLRNFPKLFEARLGQTLLKLGLAFFALFGLAFLAGGDVATNVTNLNAFLLGYSLDSFVGLFGASVEQKAQTQQGVFKKKPED